MSDREIKVDNGWVNTHSPVSKKLYAKGYTVGGYIDNGVPKYVLYRNADEKFETTDHVLFDNYLKLLLET